jgi:hypothetical protein
LPFCGKALHFSKLSSATHETKDQLGVIGKVPGRFQQCIQRVARTMIPRVHDDELLGQPMPHPESLPSRLVEAD